ncbi:hypothetical protein GYB62_02925 [bacterium]|nr:hypothetical protein [bacterium]
MTSTHHPAAELLGLADSPLRQWLVLEAIPAVHEAMGESGKASDAVTVTALPGDAGLRRYYRMQIGERQFIVMDSSTDLPQLKPFLDVHARMTASGLRAPAILAADIEQGFLVLQDFGDVLLKYILLPDDSPLPATAAQSLNELSLQQRGDRLFQQILPLLSALAQTDADNLPVYDRERLQQEVTLLPEWC